MDTGPGLQHAGAGFDSAGMMIRAGMTRRN